MWHFDGDGRARFITFCTHKRIPLLTNSHARKAIIDAIEFSRQRFNFRLYAYVIMPDYVHLMLVPHETEKAGRIVGEIKRLSAVKIIDRLINSNAPLLKNLQVKRDGVEKHAVWQRWCYDHNCRTPEKFWEKVKYCHSNPVRKGLVKDPAAWKWSSYRWYYQLDGIVLEIDSAE